MFQLFTIIGCYSTKDLITNVLGGLIGYFLYKLLYRDNDAKVIKILNICSFVVVIVLFPVVVYAIVNTNNHFDYYLNIVLKAKELM